MLLALLCILCRVNRKTSEGYWILLDGDRAACFLPRRTIDGRRGTRLVPYNRACFALCLLVLLLPEVAAVLVLHLAALPKHRWQRSLRHDA
jgi:hypothetical protein